MAKLSEIKAQNLVDGNTQKSTTNHLRHKSTQDERLGGDLQAHLKEFLQASQAASHHRGKGAL
jgi:hypothetical protein